MRRKFHLPNKANDAKLNRDLTAVFEGKLVWWDEAFIKKAFGRLDSNKISEWANEEWRRSSGWPGGGKRVPKLVFTSNVHRAPGYLLVRADQLKKAFEPV